MSNSRLVAILLLIGAGWGATWPLVKTAVSTGHGPFGLLFWEFVIATLALGLFQTLRRRRLPTHRAAVGLYLAIALLGTILPGTASFLAARHLPAGILSIAVALAPMLSFPIALLLGIDRFSAARLAGLSLGLAGVLMIALPEASLPDPAMAPWILIALIAPLAYAIEGNYVAFRGMAGCDPIEVFLGSALIGIALALPLAAATGRFIDPRAGLGRAEWAQVASSLLHVGCYTGYIWLIARAGSVFAAQVSYVVTGTGVLWSMAVLGESYSKWVWLALAAMMGGLFLVQPRR